MLKARLDRVCAYIRQQAPDFHPKVGIILGSGLGALGDALNHAVRIPYQSIPDYPVGNVVGHEQQLILGDLAGVPVICMQGRAHRYEGASNDDFKTIIYTLKQLGCTMLLATNASGSLRQEVAPGELVLVTDHINLQYSDPLLGVHDGFGERFPSMEQAYHPQLRHALQQTAAQLQLPLHEGIALAITGPCYETAAEIRMYRLLGADVIGMSTVPEVILAHYCGLKVGVISVITNFATGLVAGAEYGHEAVITNANRAAANLTRLLQTFVEKHQQLF